MTIMLASSDIAGSRKMPRAMVDCAAAVHAGAHTLRFEGPDLFLMDVNGGISAAEMAALVDRINAFAEGKEGVFGIIDMTHLRSASKEARAHLLRLAPLSGGIAYIGLKLSMRVGVSSLNALRSRLHNGVDTPITFVSTAMEAHAWVERRKRERDGQPSSRRGDAPPSSRDPWQSWLT